MGQIIMFFDNERRFSSSHYRDPPVPAAVTDRHWSNEGALFTSQGVIATMNHTKPKYTVVRPMCARESNEHLIPSIFNNVL